MIRWVTDDNMKAFEAACQSDIFGCRVESSAMAYGTGQSFLLFWEGNGCAFSLMDGVMTIAGNLLPESAEETGAFIQAVGARELVCSLDNMARLHMKEDANGPILERKGVGVTDAILGENPPVGDLYRVLEGCRGGAFLAPDFEPFYLDVSHRFRHGAAMGSVLYKDGEPAACALAVAVTQDRALLSAVGVLPRYRRQGLGSRAVEDVCLRLGKRTVSLFRDQRENAAFYQRLGFSENGMRWASRKLAAYAM